MASDPKTAALFAYVPLILAILVPNSRGLLDDCERLALLNFHDSTGGAEWLNRTNWSNGDPCSNHWYGVTCSDAATTGTNHSQITALSLESNNLHGFIPASLSNLTALTTLNVARNRLSGELPYSLGLMHSLAVLELSDNLLSGPLPSTLCGNRLVSVNVDSAFADGTFWTGILLPCLSLRAVFSVFTAYCSRLLRPCGTMAVICRYSCFPEATS